MTMRRLWLVPAISLLLASACSKSTEPSATQGAAGTAAAPSQANGTTSAAYLASQKLIRTATVRLQVADVARATRTADSIARANEGLLADRRFSEEPSGAHAAQLVLRVPTPRLDATLAALRGLGSVKSEGVETQDVTKEYTDLATRLAVKEQTVTRLRALLDARSAKLSDVLDVERELSRAITELEQMKGEQRYYDERIALSTITVELFEHAPSTLRQLTEPASSALRGSTEVLGQSVGALIYVVVAVLPWVLVAALVLWGARPLRRRLVSPPPPPKLTTASGKAPAA